MHRFIPSLPLVVFLAETVTFFLVGSVIGGGWVFLLCLISATIGVLLLQGQGLEIFFRAQKNLRDHKSPLDQIVETFWVSTAGFLFILPGFLSDLLAVALLVPFLRRGLLVLLRRLIAGSVTKPANKDSAFKTSGDQTIIDAEFEVFYENKPSGISPSKTGLSVPPFPDTVHHSNTKERPDE